MLRLLRALAELIRFGEPFAFEDDCDDDPLLSRPSTVPTAPASVFD